MTRFPWLLRLALRIGGGLLVAAAIDLALTMPAPALIEPPHTAAGTGPDGRRDLRQTLVETIAPAPIEAPSISRR
jgi:hypothetical protein